MQTANPVPSQSGEMSQGLAMSAEHPTTVKKPVLDPAARTTKRAYNALSASSVGLELGIAVIVGLLGGMWLDKHFGTTPWLMIVFLVFGLVAGFRNVLRAVERTTRAKAEQDREDGR